MEKKIYQRLAELIIWKPKDSKWVDKREEDIEQINNQYYNEAVEYVTKEYPGLKGYDLENKISECADYIDEEGIAEYITECFYDWFLTECKEVK